jgi:hypothetical protein
MAGDAVNLWLRRSPPDRPSAVPYGQAGKTPSRFPRLAHRSAAAHKLHSTTATTRIDSDSGKGETISRIPALAYSPRKLSRRPGPPQSEGHSSSSLLQSTSLRLRMATRRAMRTRHVQQTVLLRSLVSHLSMELDFYNPRGSGNWSDEAKERSPLTSQLSTSYTLNWILMTIRVGVDPGRNTVIERFVRMGPLPRSLAS